MRASILIVGHQFPSQVEFGADHAPSYDAALAILQDHNYAVLVSQDYLPEFAGQRVKTSFNFLSAVRKIQSNIQIIAVSDRSTVEDLQRQINEIGIFKVIGSFEQSGLLLAVREGLEEFELIGQNEAFIFLIQEQHARLQQMSGVLEKKVEERKAFLLKTREELFASTKKIEALNRAIVAIQKSLSINEIERLLTDALHAALNLTWIRVIYQDQWAAEAIEAHKGIHVLGIPLVIKSKLLGHIYFARANTQPFNAEEDDFLLQIGDAVSLTLDRLKAIEATENLKQEWDSTFDAITDPVAVINENYEILRANKAYVKKAATSFEKLQSVKCFEVLFGRSKPCEGCHLGENFELGETQCGDGSRAQFMVNSRIIELHKKQTSFALFYRDVLEEQKIQRQILESSKMAEIGTIGSSIAHEINNPLGGMLAFLQLLKGEVSPPHPLYADVVDMEQAALRCKSIAENLLAFTRQSSQDREPARLGDLIKMALGIVDLQARGAGIQIEHNESIHCDVTVLADSNQLVQVFVNIMQNSCEAIAERMNHGTRQPPGKITITVNENTPDSEHITLRFQDNGTGIETANLARVFTPFFTTKDKTKNPGLGLSISYQIVKDHEGQVEVSSQFGKETSVSVALKIAKSPTGPEIF